MVNKFESPENLETRFDQSSPVQPVSEIQRSQKISKHHFFLKIICLKKKNPVPPKKKYAILLVFPYQEDAIPRELSSPARFRNPKILNSLKKSLFFNKKIEEKKCRKKMLSSQFSNRRRTRFDQSSPVQPVSESRGGFPEHDGQSPNGRNPCV